MKLLHRQLVIIVLVVNAMAIPYVVSGQERVSIKAHGKKVVLNVASSFGGQQLASVGLDRNVRVWDVKEQTCVQTFAFDFDNQHRPEFAEWLPSGEALLVATKRFGRFPGAEIWLCNIRTGKRHAQWFSQLNQSVLALWAGNKTAVVYSKEAGNRSAPHTLKFVDLDSGKGPIVTFTEFTQLLAFSRDKKLVVIEEGKGKVKVVEIATAKVLAAYRLSEGQCDSCLLTPDNRTLIVVAQFNLGRIHFVDVATGREKFMREVTGWVYKLADISPNGKVMAVLQSEANVWFFDLEKERFQSRQSLPGARILGLRFMPDGRSYLTNEKDGRICVFDMPKIDP